MEPKFQIAAAALCGALITVVVIPGFPTAIAFSAACALFGFLHFIERERKQALIELREDLEKQIKDMKGRLDGLALRGLGR